MAPKKTSTRARRGSKRSAKSPNPLTSDHEFDHAAEIRGDGETGPAVFRVQGPMSTFGGPHDLGMSPSEGLALFDRPDLLDPRHRELFLPFQPPGTTGLGRRLNPEKHYIACRWDYHTTSRSFLRNTVARVQSIRTGRVIDDARPADWGPNAATGRVADLSPRLAAALELDTDDEVLITISGERADFVTPEARRAFAGGANGGTTEPRIHNTSEWGARPATVAHFPERSAVGIVVHNTQDPNRPPLTGNAEFQKAANVARTIQNSHMDERHWADTGQHFTISRGGLILEGRHGSLQAARAGRVVSAAHAVSADGSANRTWFGIELEGDNRGSDQVTAPQYKSLVELSAWLTKWAGTMVLPMKGHMDVLAGHTDCPGKFENRLPQLRQDVAAKRAELG